MKLTVISSILLFTGVIVGSSHVKAKKAGSKSYTCISAKNGKFVITDSIKTNKFKLYGVIFPTKKTIKLFSKDSDTKVEDLKNSLPNLNNYLSRYNGRTVKIKKSFGRSVWLEDSNGKSINLEVVESGIALPVKNVKRQYKKQFQKARCEAVKNAVGIWALPPDRDPSRDVRIKYSAKNMIKDKESRSYKYSASSYTKNKKWNNIREITLDFNTFDLNRKIDLLIKYQWKIASYEEGAYRRTNNRGYRRSSKRDISWSEIYRKTISIYPPDNQQIVIKSPEVSMRKYTDSDDGATSLSGKDYAGDAVAIYYNDEEIFKRGELKSDDSQFERIVD